jgi:hypothetical protein
MLVLASIVQSLFYVSMWTTYSNIIDIKRAKLIYRILLVSYTWYGPTSWSDLDHVALQSHFNKIWSSKWL